jgi:hypothetical protein
MFKPEGYERQDPGRGIGWGQRPGQRRWLAGDAVCGGGTVQQPAGNWKETSVRGETCPH